MKGEMHMTYLSPGQCKQCELALHTHDSITYKRCRRKWQLSSPFGLHLAPKASVMGVSSPLWFGSGFHFALEDRYGYNRFGGAVKAFDAYVESFLSEELPEDIEELVELGHDMLGYFETWMTTHANWKIVHIEGKPLVEVPFSLVLSDCCYYEDLNDGDRYFRAPEGGYESSLTHIIFSDEQMQQLLAKEAVKYCEVVFHGKLDAVVEDEEGRWFVLDYKTAKAINTGKLALDPQISKYCWAAEQWFQHEIAGMIYVQVSKSPPKAPKKTTRGISSDKRQRVTYEGYEEALRDYYGSIEAAPEACLSFLADLEEEEDENGNKFVRVDRVYRNEQSKLNTYQHIVAEGLEMLRPELAIYPNPTKDCSWDCPFMNVCLAMEEGADWKFLLDGYEVRNETMKDEVPMWEQRLYRHHRDLYPEEFEKYWSNEMQDVDTFIDQLSE